MDLSDDLDDDYRSPVPEDDPDRPAAGYEYLDHTADVQLHAWGPTLNEAFEQTAVAMFGYMTDLNTVEDIETMEIEAEGEDLQSVLFKFLDEWLYAFSAETNFIPWKVVITEFDRTGPEGTGPEGTRTDRTEGRMRIRAKGFGETFSLEKHPQGTEVKAITYSAMDVREKEGFCETFVIIDI